jgi:outer membrane protein assembly factor BamB
MHRLFVTLGAVAALIGPLRPAVAQTSVLTRSYDNFRTGWNQEEQKLTPAAVQAQGLQSISLVPGNDDPRIEAQPLYVPGLAMADGRKHDVIFVCTMSNNVWAFDANTGAKIWTQPSFLGQPFLPTWNDAVDSKHINRSFGILSTPAIDLENGIMYLVDWDTNDAGHQNRSLHVNAIRLTDGKLVPGKSAMPFTTDGKPLSADNKNAISVANSSGQKISLSQVQKQRAALLLVPQHGKASPPAHKMLYVAFTGTEEPSNNGDPTRSLHGWVVAFDVDAWKQAGQWVATPNSFGGGIWQGSQGPASDSGGNVYLITGNGGYKVVNGKNVDVGIGVTDFPESFVRLSQTGGPQGSSLSLSDWFIPFTDSNRTNWTNSRVAPFPAGYDYHDQDLGSAGPLLPPGTNLLLGAGKDGILYAMDRNNLGRAVGDLHKLKIPPEFFTFDPDRKIPAYKNASASSPNQDYQPMQGVKTHHLHGTPIYVNTTQGPRLFAWGENGTLREFSLDPVSGQVHLMAHGADVASADLASPASLTMGGMPGGMLAASSHGLTGGIVWTTAPVIGDANQTVVDGAVRAYGVDLTLTTKNPDGIPRLQKLWENTGFKYSKFCPPVIADGRVIVPTYDGRVIVYTLKPAVHQADNVKTPGRARPAL